MVHVSIHFTQECIRVQFESDYAFTKWLGYLKEHNAATVRLAESGGVVIVFRDNVTYMSIEGEARDIALG
jgi:hypothetical protein